MILKGPRGTVNREVYENLLANGRPEDIDLGTIGLAKGLEKMENEPNWAIFSSLVGIVTMPEYPCR